MNKLTPQKFLETFEGFDFDEAFTDHELEQITNAMSAYHKYASAPTSPVGIENELYQALLQMYGQYSAMNVTTGEKATLSTSLKVIEKFKAGYSASLPQSSTEEDKELVEKLKYVDHVLSDDGYQSESEIRSIVKDVMNYFKTNL